MLSATQDYYPFALVFVNVIRQSTLCISGINHSHVEIVEQVGTYGEGIAVLYYKDCFFAFVANRIAFGVI